MNENVFQTRNLCRPANVYRARYLAMASTGRKYMCKYGLYIKPQAS